ncbi:MAG: membrane dipeptidase [Myxococcota bacterium]
MWLLPLSLSAALAEPPEPSEPTASTPPATLTPPSELQGDPDSPTSAAPALSTVPEVHANLDWQGHPAMHLTWKFFSRGLTDRTPPRSYRHRFRQIAERPWLEASGVRIFLMAAMAAEKARNPEHARALILKELAYVEAFVAAHPDGWALAKTPAEARTLLATTDKRVVIHSIEGGHLLLSGPDDARFWADQGVALITVMHLRDDELGGAGILPMRVGPLINPVGARRTRRGERRGLTERGAAAIVELDRAGILVDLSHMSPDTIDDALAVTRSHGIAPVVTHGKLARLQHSDLAFRDDQVLEIVRQGGTFALGISPSQLDPQFPTDEVPDDVCRSTVEMFAYHWDAVHQLLLAHADELVGSPADALTSAQQTRLAVGWSSDWNGWIGHAAPVYGRGRCRPRAELPEPASTFDTRGLANPSLLPEQWAAMERLGYDLDPMWRSAERFLALWERAYSNVTQK